MKLKRYQEEIYKLYTYYRIIPECCKKSNLYFFFKCKIEKIVNNWRIVEATSDKKVILFQDTRGFEEISNLLDKRYKVIHISCGCGLRTILCGHDNRLRYSVDKLIRQVTYVYRYNQYQKLERIVSEVQRQFLKYGVEIVVLTNDINPFERVIAIAARESGIPVFCIQHGYEAFNCGDIAYYGESSGKFITWGQYFKDEYVKHNIMNEQDIYVLGYPHLQLYEHEKGNSGNSIEGKEKSKKRSIMFIGTNWKAYNEDVTSTVYKLIYELSVICDNMNIVLQYRHHPLEAREELKKVFDNCNNLVISGEESLYIDMNKVDIVIGIESTVFLEANAMGKMTIKISDIVDSEWNMEELQIAYACPFSDVPDLIMAYYKNAISPKPYTEYCLYKNTNFFNDLCSLFECKEENQ